MGVVRYGAVDEDAAEPEPLCLSLPCVHTQDRAVRRLGPSRRHVPVLSMARYNLDDDILSCVYGVVVCGGGDDGSRAAAMADRSESATRSTA